MNRDTLHALARRWRQAAYGRELSFAAGAGCLAAVPVLFRPTPGWVWCAVAVVLAVLAGRLALSRPWRIDAARLAGHLDRTHPETEESAALFLKPPEQLTVLERLQLQRVRPRVETLGFGRPPRRFLDAAIFWLAAACILTLSAAWLRWHPMRGAEDRSRDQPVPGHDSPRLHPPRPRGRRSPAAGCSSRRRPTRRTRRAGWTVSTPKSRKARRSPGLSSSTGQCARRGWFSARARRARRRWK